jgi:hypothetical protein
MTQYKVMYETTAGPDKELATFDTLAECRAYRETLRGQKYQYAYVTEVTERNMSWHEVATLIKYGDSEPVRGEN